MATLHPFRALRPSPADAARIAAVPYDVVNADEARALADANPLSFLRVSRAEIELPPETDPYGDAVYARAAANFSRLKNQALVLETEPSVYFYRLRMGSHEQVGLAGCFSLAEYDRDVIKKHERTRRDKEDDRTRHMLALRAQTGPVFLTHRASAEVDRHRRAHCRRRPPLIDFAAADGVQHTLWQVAGADRDALVAAFARLPSLYIADGHHRAASAARARTEMRDRGLPGEALGDGADFNTVLAVAFPHDQVQILPYNRIVKDLGGLVAGPIPGGGQRGLYGVARTGRAGRPRRHRHVHRAAVAHAPPRVWRLTRRIRSVRWMSACCRTACSPRSSGSPTSEPTNASSLSAAPAAPASSRRM